MRTISSRRFVGELLPPVNWLPLFGAGKMPPKLPPATSRAAASGLIMHAGIWLPGNACPCTTPAGAAPPGQLAKRTDGATRVVEGTLTTWVPKFPVYQEVSGTVCWRVLPLIYFRHSML